MKLWARCEKCSKLGEVTHGPGYGGLYAQGLQMQSAACTFHPQQGWQTIAGKTFCGDCSGIIQAALDAAMRPT